MADCRKAAGVILAGGRSSRMGSNKALLDYKGVLLVDHMTGLLKAAGLQDIFISGQLDGYDCLPDRIPFSGPAAAIRDIVCRLDTWDGVLFVPVDMPLLTPDLVRQLLAQPGGAQFDGWPLPLYWPVRKTPGAGESVRQMTEEKEIKVLSVSEDIELHFKNLNTPEEWTAAVGR